MLSENITQIVITGVSGEFGLWMVAAVFCFLFIIASFFIKSPVMNWIVSLLSLPVIFEPNQDQWIQMAFAIVMLWGIVAGILRTTSKGERGI